MLWERLRTIWTIPDLRKKIFFTLSMLVIFRVLAHITVPLSAAEQNALLDVFQKNNSGGVGQLFGLLDVFSGGSLKTFSIVAMGVYPYITATIVMQLLQPIIPALMSLQQQGESGRMKFNQITRLVTVPLALLQALAYCAIFKQQGVLTAFNAFDPALALNTWAILLSLTAGTMLLVWLGELITEKGIGNGISVIIFGGIVTGLPGTIVQEYTKATQGGGSGGVVSLVGLVLAAIVTIVATVYIYLGQRRVSVHYPTKRMVGRGMLVGSAQTTYIPIQVNSAGMIPLIFAQSMLLFPSVISQYLAASGTPWLEGIASWVSLYLVNTSLWWYWAIYFVMVVAFTYFYAYVMFQQQNIPENLQKQGAFIPGYRPGEPTSKYLYDILKRVTLAGAVFLGLIAVLPFLLQSQVLSGASLLIVVGVVLDTLRQLEAQMVMRNYSGFLS